MLKITLIVLALAGWSLAKSFLDPTSPQVVLEKPSSGCICPSAEDDCCSEMPTTNAVTKLTPEQLASFAPYLQFARAAYCPANLLNEWDCGEACDAIPDFHPSLVDGDGDGIQRYIVGFWSSKKTVVVAHEGTDPTKFIPFLTDSDLELVDLDSNLFPNLPPGIQVHEGFRNEHAQTIAIIFKEVNRLLASTGASNVTFIGHSLGGALAQLDSLYFALHLQPSVGIVTTTFGTPRVGNAAYAAFYNTKATNFQRINNKRDPIPIVPGRDLKYQHPHGEIHILSPGHAVACPGNDDAVDPQCQIKTVPDIFEGSILDHLGPYEGIFLGTIFCF